MLIGRFMIIVPLLARIAWNVSTHGPLAVTLITGTVLILGALTFIPVLSLGPIVGHFLMHELRVF